MEKGLQISNFYTFVTIRKDTKPPEQNINTAKKRILDT